MRHSLRATQTDGTCMRVLAAVRHWRGGGDVAQWRHAHLQKRCLHGSTHGSRKSAPQLGQLSADCSVSAAEARRSASASAASFIVRSTSLPPLKKLLGTHSMRQVGPVGACLYTSKYSVYASEWSLASQF